MSLGHVLGLQAGCQRARVADHLLKQCRAADAVVVENILTLVQDTVPCANITLAAMRVHSHLYEITVPVRSGRLSLLQLSTLQAYNPARVADIQVVLLDQALCLVLSVCDETRPVRCSQIDIVRICKRAKTES